jgi:hypothetical protein
VAICFLFLKPLTKITQVRGAIVIPIILVLIYLGAFAEKNAFEDMLVVLFFGALGWVMEKLDWPRPPVLLGLVLGPLAENRLFLSSDNYGSAWLTRPGVLIIFAITVIGVVYPIIKNRREATHRAESDVQPQPVDAPRHTGFRFGAAALFTIVVAGMIAIALFQSRNFGYRAGLFPWVIGIPTLILALLQLAKDTVGREKPEAALAAWEVAAFVEPDVARKRTINVLIWIVGFFLAIWLLGFIYSIPLSMLLYLRLAGRENWPMAIAVSFFTWLFVYGLFEKLLSVPFPDGWLFAMFQQI